MNLVLTDNTNFIEIPILAEKLLKEFQLAKRGWKFQWGFSTNYVGLCRIKVRIIEISHDYAAQNSLKVIENTIRHEIAHALHWEIYHETGHNETWRSLAFLIGAIPRAKNPLIAKITKNPRYVAQCCRTHYRRRKPRRHTTYHCKACKKTLLWTPVVGK